MDQTPDPSAQNAARTAQLLADRYGLPLVQLRGLVDRYAACADLPATRLGASPDGLMFQSWFEDALDWLEPGAALRLFEQSDPADFWRRVAGTEYLARPLTPLLTIEELIRAADLLLSSDSSKHTAQRSPSRVRSRWLEWSLGVQKDTSPRGTHARRRTRTAPRLSALQEGVLGALLESAKARDTSGLSDRLQLLLLPSSWSDGKEYSGGGQDVHSEAGAGQVQLDEAGPRFEPGSIQALLAVVQHFWREIEGGTFDRARAGLRDLTDVRDGFVSLQVRSYYEAALDGRASLLDQVIDRLAQDQEAERRRTWPWTESAPDDMAVIRQSTDVPSFVHRGLSAHFRKWHPDVHGTYGHALLDYAQFLSSQQQHISSGRSRRIPKRVFDPGPDFRVVQFRGQRYTLTQNQAAIVQYLYESYCNGHPDVGQKRLLEHVESPTTQLRDCFKSRPDAWKALIRRSASGIYRLNLD